MTVIPGIVFSGLAGLAAPASWTQEFHLRDDLNLYSYPAELLTYRVVLPAGVTREQLRLEEVTATESHPVMFQIAPDEAAAGGTNAVQVRFRTDLPQGGARNFRLQAGSAPLQAATNRVGICRREGNQAWIGSNRLRASVPAGSETFPQGASLVQVPAPLLALARAPDFAPCGQGSWSGPDHIQVMGWNAAMLEEGPLLARYQIRYRLAGGRSYRVTLTLRQDEPFVSIAEELEGFRPQDETYFRFAFTPGLAPDQRWVMSNGGYDRYSGAYDKEAGPGGKLPFELGLNTPNSLGVMRACTLFADQGAHALLVVNDRLEEWQTAERRVWNDARGPGNLNFYQAAGGGYLQTRLEGRRRYWVLALIPRQEVVLNQLLTSKRAKAVPRPSDSGGPEVRLWQRLSDFSLDAVKDWVFDWNETLTPNAGTNFEALSYEEWMKAFGPQSAYPFLPRIVNCFWDHSATTGPPSFRAMPRAFGQYAASRAQWTPEQRRQARAILLFLAYTAERDTNLPHTSMLAGHPNFISDVKCTLPLACVTFPNHPHARRWRDSFVRYYEEWLNTFQRDPDPEHHALGGRWTENIACYSGTCLTGILQTSQALRAFDGTDLLANPRVRAWTEWYLQSIMSPHDGVRLVPPEGAHAHSFEPGERSSHREVLFALAAQLGRVAPELSRQMRWVETNGKEGDRPALASVLIRDHGPFLRYDFGGPHEAYLHLTQICGHYNYRWGDGADVLYYGARNKAWSYNTVEAAGDEFNLNHVTSFSVNGKGLGRHSTDQPLYDFDFAQYYRAPGTPEQNPQYLSRGLMLMRDDYLVLFDEVAGQAEGIFTWATCYDPPQIYQLKPGAAVAEQPYVEKTRTGLVTAAIRQYKGRGSFLTVVAPAPVPAQAAPFGAVVQGEFVFCSDQPVRHENGQVRFSGRVGYARPGQLALFDGDRLGLDDLELRRDGGDFGASLRRDHDRLTGRLAGRAGGQVTVILPQGFNPQTAKVLVSGEKVPAVVEGRSLRFPVAISLRDGWRDYEITF